MTPDGSFSLNMIYDNKNIFCKTFKWLFFKVRSVISVKPFLAFFVSAAFVSWMKRLSVQSKYPRLCGLVSEQMVMMAAWRQRRRRCRTTGWSVWTTWPPHSSNWSSATRRCTPAGTFWPSSQTTSRPFSERERWAPLLSCCHWEAAAASHLIAIDPKMMIAQCPPERKRDLFKRVYI